MPDAIIREVEYLPDSLPGAQRAGLYAQAAPGALLQIVPGVARFLARDGATIEVASEREADPRAVRLFIDGIMRAALIYQRGELPLHSASLVDPRCGHAVAICGPSGIGKSTIAAELCRQGWSLLADDNSRVSFDGTRSMVWPSNGAIKLWRDACDAGALDAETLERVRPELEKYYLPVASRPDPCPLAAVVELRLPGDCDLREVHGVARLAMLSENGYRPRLVGPLGGTAEHVAIVSKVASKTRLFRLGQARVANISELAAKIASVLP